MAAPRDQAAASLEDATVALINSDPELRAELRALIRDATARMRHTIAYGNAAARESVLKAIVPGMIKAMGRVEQSASEAELRAVYERISRGVEQELSTAGG